MFESQGWTVHDLAKDYGEDLMVRIFENSQATPFLFFVQAKSKEQNVSVRSSNDSIPVRVSRDHLDHWRRFWEPVILTVWVVQSDITYWECVQNAVVRLERRGNQIRGKKTVTIHVPMTQILDATGVNRISQLTRVRFSQFQRERDATEYLLDLLREEIGLKIDYQSRYGIVLIPEGSFVPDKEASQRVYVFGRAKRDIDRLARLLSIPIQEAFDYMLNNFLNGLQSLLRGEAAVFRSPNGDILDIWNSPKDVTADYYRMLDEADEDE
jgi:hypothetical protein